MLSTEIKKEGLKIATQELYDLVQSKNRLVKKFYSLETLTDAQGKRLQSEEQDIKTLVAYQQSVTSLIKALETELQVTRQAAEMWKEEYLRQAQQAVNTTETYIQKVNGLRKAG